MSLPSLVRMSSGVDERGQTRFEISGKEVATITEGRKEKEHL